MSSGSSTEPSRSGDSGLQPWHFYLLLSMAGAVWAVIVSRDTHPAALLLISAAVVAAGLTATAFHHALAGFLGSRTPPMGAVLDPRSREALGREKALVLRSLKELEFDHAMRKVSDRDFAEIGSRLRARAMELMRDMDRASPSSETVTSLPAPVATPVPPAAASPFAELGGQTAPAACATCGTANDADARFCKSCGTRLA
jgi:hypothetical protein